MSIENKNPSYKRITSFDLIGKRIHEVYEAISNIPIRMDPISDISTFLFLKRVHNIMELIYYSISLNLRGELKNIEKEIIMLENNSTSRYFLEVTEKLKDLMCELEGEMDLRAKDITKIFYWINKEYHFIKI